MLLRAPARRDLFDVNGRNGICITVLIAEDSSSRDLINRSVIRVPRLLEATRPSGASK